MLNSFSIVDYHTYLSNFYASCARLLRGVHYFEIRGYRFTLFAVFDDKGKEL